MSDELRIYTPKDVMALLQIGRSVYYQITAVDGRSRRRLLEYSRLRPGGPRRHTQAQIDAYIEYLNAAGAVSNAGVRGQGPGVRARMRLAS